MLLFYLKDLSVLKGLFTLRFVGDIIDFLYLNINNRYLVLLYLRYYQHRGDIMAFGYYSVFNALLVGSILLSGSNETFKSFYEVCTNLKIGAKKAN